MVFKLGSLFPDGVYGQVTSNPTHPIKMGGSSSSLSNSAISDITMSMSNSSKISSIINADSSQSIAIFGNNNTVKDVTLTLDLAVTNYCQNEAKLDAGLAQELSAKFTASAKDSQVAALGALNNSSTHITNMVKNSVAVAISTNTVQKCLIDMAAKQSISINGNNNVIAQVTMNDSRKAVQTCLNAAELNGNIASQLKSWTSESSKNSQVGPLDGLFKALQTLAGAPGEIALAMIAGGVLIFLSIIFILFHGGSVPAVSFNSKDGLSLNTGGSTPTQAAQEIPTDE